jgi:hypothetical protein
MKLRRRTFLHLSACAALLPAMPRAASALDYPTRPVRIAIGGCTYYCFGCDIAGGSWPVLHDERLAQPLRQPLTDQPRSDVHPTSGGKTDDDAALGQKRTSAASFDHLVGLHQECLRDG